MLTMAPKELNTTNIYPLDPYPRKESLECVSTLVKLLISIKYNLLSSESSICMVKVPVTVYSRVDRVEILYTTWHIDL